MHRVAITLSLLLLSFVYGGPNQNAKLYLDFDPKTLSADTIGGCLKDSLITVAVRIEGASRLYSYQLYVKHDTASLRYISGKAGSDQFPTLLEKNGGSISFFTAKPSKFDSTRISVGVSLSGNDASQCVSDSGILCLLNFKHRKDDTTKITIDSTLFQDCDSKQDTGLACISGTMVPSTGVSVSRMQMVRNGVLPKVAVYNGRLHVDFGSPTKYVVVAVNTLGKRIGTSTGIAGKFSFDCRDAIAGNRPVGGLSFVRIRWSGNELTVPVLR